MAGQTYKDCSRPGIDSTPSMRKKISAPGAVKARVAPSDSLLEASKKAQERFQNEQRAKAIKGWLSWGLLGGLFVFILIGYALGLFDDFIRLILIPERGVYADCNLPENRHSKFCVPEKTTADIQWDALSTSGGKAVPYTLSGSGR
jgi:hypothetical protein